MHGHEAGAVVGLRGRSGGRGGAQHVRSAPGHGRGALAQSHQGIALKTGGHGFALLHGHQAGVHGEAVAQLIEAAVNDQFGAGLVPKAAGRGQIDAVVAAAFEQGAGPVHGHGLEAVLFQLADDELRHIAGGIGHVRPGIDLEGQHQNQGLPGLGRHDILGGQRL